jgi:anti-sigma28 factor (negative regulator of flagellin synthesis)
MKRVRSQAEGAFARLPRDVANIARPESVVMLAATVRAARELHGRALIEALKERVSEGGYKVSSKDLAARVLSTTP